MIFLAFGLQIWPLKKNLAFNNFLGLFKVHWVEITWVCVKITFCSIKTVISPNLPIRISVREGNPGNVLLNSRIHLKYFFHCLFFLSMWISSDEFLRHRFSLSKTFSKARDSFRNDIGYFLAKVNGNFQTQKLVRSCTCLPRKK